MTVTDPATRQDATTADRKAVLWESGFERALRGLGQRTIVIHPVPHFGQWPWDWQPEACPLPRMINHSCPVGRIDRRDVAIQQGRAKAVENGVARRVHGVSTVDFTDDICTDLGCATDRFLPWLYRDATHLSVDGALRRTDYFKGLIAATAGG